MRDLKKPTFQRNLEDTLKKCAPYTYKGMCRCSGVVYEWTKSGEQFCHSCHNPKIKFNQ